MNPLRTKSDLLRHLLTKNEHGVWFVKCDTNKYYPLSRWIWPYCEKIAGKLITELGESNEEEDS